MLMRDPPPALRGVVKSLWVARPEADDAENPGARRERMMPSGIMHLVFRLSGPPIRLFAGLDDARGETFGHAVVGGARSGFYLRDEVPGVHVIGIELEPGAARRVLGVPAGELAERHTPLESVWGGVARGLRDRLAEPRSLAAQLDLFAELLTARLAPIRAMHPAVAHALSLLPDGRDIGTLVRESGYSHRRFIALFRDAVGMSPKTFQRVRRFHDTLRMLIARPELPLVEVALAAGYSDQSHFNREFRELGGISPSEYRRAEPVWPQHVRVP